MLKGKTAFISGGSGAVGAACVRIFAREGCSVAFSYHQHADGAQALAAELTAAGARVRPGTGSHVPAVDVATAMQDADGQTGDRVWAKH